MSRIRLEWVVGIALVFGGCADRGTTAPAKEATTPVAEKRDLPCTQCRCPNWAEGGDGDACGRGFCAHPLASHP